MTDRIDRDTYARAARHVHAAEEVLETALAMVEDTRGERSRLLGYGPCW